MALGSIGPNSIPAVILAGGRGTRLGPGPKALVTLAGRPLVDHVIDRLTPQADPIAINANDALSELATRGLPVLPDALPGRLGPLAGMHAALTWAQGAHAVLVVPTDTPFLPPDLIVRLEAARDSEGAAMAVATSHGRPHPVVALLTPALTPALELILKLGESLDATALIGRFGATLVPFPAAEGGDPFFNVNTGPDRVEAEARMAHQAAKRAANTPSG